MILTIAEDFTNTTVLDSELTSVPESGMYLNSGVHSSITVQNLLQFLPNIEFTFAAYNVATTYGKYTDTRKATDIVLDGGVIYQSLVAANVGNAVADTTKWQATDIDSLRIKSFVLRSQDAAIRKISLNRRLVDSQYLYNVAEVEGQETTTQLLPNDYAAWVFEPRGSDYTTFRINQVALQATTAAAQNLYVINQGQLVTTLILNTNAEGRLEFEDLNYTFNGKGKWVFAIDSQNVLVNGSYIDPLKYDGFVVYTASGIGTTPEGSTYSFSNTNNGLNFNVTTYFDGTVYIDNNLMDLGNYIQAAWELDVLNMFLSNSNTRSNKEQRNVIDREMLKIETKRLDVDTVARRFEKARDGAISRLKKTFDRELDDNDDDGIEVEIGSV